MDLDDYQEELGDISRVQLIQIIAIGLLAAGQGIGSPVFLTAVPSHRCQLPFENQTTTFEAELPNASLYYPMKYGEISSCERFNYNYSKCNGEISMRDCLLEQANITTTNCENGWIYSKEYYEETTISEWDLVCEYRSWESLANSMYFLGFLLGTVILGPLVDRFGRRRTLLVFCVISLFLNIPITINKSYGIFVVLRLVLGACNNNIYIIAYTLCAEISSTKFRTKAAFLIFGIGPVVPILLPLMFYLAKHWRIFNGTVATIEAISLITFIWIEESPRWLLVKGREKEAKKIVSRQFKSKKVPFSEEKWQEVVRTEKKKIEDENQKTKYNYIDLLRYPMLRIVTLNVMFCWFVTSFTYYGLILNITKLNGNPYINATINALLGWISCFVTLLADRFGRRILLHICYVCAGLGCLLPMFATIFFGPVQAVKTFNLIMALCGRFWIGFSFNLVYMVATEVMPTCIRGTGMAMGSMFARIGGMFMPFTLQLQYERPWLTQMIFGIVAISAAFSTLLFTETTNLNFISTIHEAENFYREKMKKTAAFFRVKKIAITMEDEKLKSEAS